MDPDEALREALALARRLVEPMHYTRDDAERLAELVLALDDWLSRGGFRPAAWQQKGVDRG